ncbi:MAG: immunoglobulin-like domain-containing protein [[Clostridium] innocuum]
MRKSQYITFILCVLLICLGCWYFLFPKPADKDDLSITFKDTEKVKLNEKIEPVDLIRSTTSVKILYPTIDTSSPGVKKLLYIAVGEDGGQKEFMKEIRVVAPKPPVLQLKKDKVEIYVKEVFDARSYVRKAYSDYDGDLDVSIRGSYDVKKAGTYTITYKVKDSSGHTATKELRLIVKEKEEAPKEKEPQHPQKEERPSTTQPPKEQDTTTGSAPDPEAEKPQEPAPSIGVQTWLFANGESFSSAQEKCNAAGVASGRRYQCDVLQDDAGIYTGYRLDLR